MYYFPRPDPVNKWAYFDKTFKKQQPERERAREREKGGAVDVIEFAQAMCSD